MKVLKHLFDNNRKWADNRKKSDPDFFNKLVLQQKPEHLWIGCSDSRVPANEIVGLLPGELFVHRNVANLVVENDLNCLSVIQFAVDVLKVKHIIVCGHYGCGGVKAVLENSKLGLTDDWLSNLKLIKEKYSTLLEQNPDDSSQISKLCELNVIEQVYNVCSTNIVLNAWKRNQPLTIHGWIYDIKDGLLQDLGVCIANYTELQNSTKTDITKFFNLKSH
ncbi:MAG: carbonate dehydratase [Ignavibacteriota bacterium]|nr:MAG: carbonate dehydratase [Chlorobiota bacterium]MBE7477031.1 carbonate dehydratase [Ignavibacteriales bacterium]MBL1121718.1 carbonate dehydratase [Ignavibacteriota bacterium]MCE7857492.1 carbonate dehydratase [Ignavibacteria bacterium CHB3]MCZ7613651.1 carbonate dehydratase [Ignavibacteriaceae bacterium]MEB2297428.1 carbonate dehydratase [Ignavibacteria bacterium]